jgi:hypothetical protein
MPGPLVPRARSKSSLFRLERPQGPHQAAPSSMATHLRNKWPATLRPALSSDSLTARFQRIRFDRHFRKQAQSCRVVKRLSSVISTTNVEAVDVR